MQCGILYLNSNMKVFFTASLRGQKEFGVYYKTIFDTLSDLGFKHLDNEILTLSKNYYDKIQHEGRSAFVDLYQRKMKHLKEADICMFECTLPSLSIGYQILKALDFNRPTIILYLNDNVPQFISGIDNEKLIVKKYTPDTLTDVVTESLQEASGIQDKRFNFFISPPLLNYLQKESKSKGVTQSTFIRNLILTHKKKSGK